MARNKKPCDLCGEDLIDSLGGLNGHQLYAECYWDNGLMVISSFAPDENGESQELQWGMDEINYCPKCGRKLGY